MMSWILTIVNKVLNSYIKYLYDSRDDNEGQVLNFLRVNKNERQKSL